MYQKSSSSTIDSGLPPEYCLIHMTTHICNLSNFVLVVFYLSNQIDIHQTSYCMTFLLQPPCAIDNFPIVWKSVDVLKLLMMSLMIVISHDLFVATPLFNKQLFSSLDLCRCFLTNIKF